MKVSRRHLLASALALTCSLTGSIGHKAQVHAHDIVPGAPQQQPVLIENTTLHIGDGSVKRDTSLLFDQGMITRIGRNVERPEKVTVIDGRDKHVYPGLIDAFTNLGLREITAVDVTVDNSERGDENPNVRSWVAFNPDSELIPVARAGGVMAAHVVPGGRWIQGQSAVMQLDGWGAKDMLISGPCGLCVNWESMVPRGSDAKANAKRYDEQIAKMDDLLDQARRYRDQRAADPSAASDVRLESWIPVVEGERPVFVQADRMATIESAIGYFTTREIPLVLCGAADAMHCIDSIRDHDVPVILIGTYRLPRRRHDAYDALYELPSQLAEAGVRFAIAGEGSGYPGGASNVRNLPYHAGVAVAYGLDREQAVRSVTGSPAEILGVADRIGTLANDKEATLIIVDGDVLESDTQVVDAYIQGRKVDLRSRHRQLYDKYKQK
ncbi:amidohydrolase family protein [Allorhodopirellula solitaria]|uniref:Imidazolonepropionase n=1 Tax=Allorhodopirellula solitaria TaxID=2527987 RepID=A0A5C5YJW9_9BACT|nr:amidohydrolase family protein [Allorhodopirellula solitaria]TWT75142.1 imidazolonepropionase [Allorhodopirellula solitaria]